VAWHRESLETEAAALLKPKLEALRQIFEMVDMDKDGRISTRELAAFQAVLAQRIQAELAAAAEAAAAAPDGPAFTGMDSKIKAMLSLDVEANLAEMGDGGQDEARDDYGFLYLDFDRFKSLLARHADALAGRAKDGGGKKGKKKK
jgi:hypothetical protein